MSRYDLPDPLCHHSTKPPNPAVRVTSGLPEAGPFASIWVCPRPECIEDAKEWAYASTHIEPVLFRRDHD